MSAVRPKLEKVFAIHGIPDFVKSDNSPPFDRHAFEDYAKEKGFIHKHVTPLWPEANRTVERFMQPLVKSARASAVAGRNWKKQDSHVCCELSSYATFFNECYASSVADEQIS